jgi:hypothetical protein
MPAPGAHGKHPRQDTRGADASTASQYADTPLLPMESVALRVQIQPEAGGGNAGFDWLGRIPLLRRLVFGAPDPAQP